MALKDDRSFPFPGGAGLLIGAALALAGCGKAPEADAKAAVFQSARPPGTAAIHTESAMPGCKLPRGGVLAATSGDRIAFGAGVQKLVLHPACASFAEAVHAAPPDARFVLVVEDLRVAVQPGAVFHLSLSAPHAEDSHVAVLGALSFFAAHRKGSSGAAAVSYDVTQPLRRLVRERRLEDGLAVVIAPSTPPRAGSDASASAIRILAQ